MRRAARLQIVTGDVGARLDRVHALVLGHVEEDGPGREAARLLDAAVGGSVAG